MSAVILGLFGNSPVSGAPNTIIAYDVPAGTVGNSFEANLVVGNDFRVVNPITVWYLGVFNSGTNGIQGSTVLTVQLWERSGAEAGRSALIRNKSVSDCSGFVNNFFKHLVDIHGGGVNAAIR